MRLQCMCVQVETSLNLYTFTSSEIHRPTKASLSLYKFTSSLDIVDTQADQGFPVSAHISSFVS